MATLAELIRGFTPPTESALADPIKQHFKTLPAQTAANLLRQRQNIDESLALDQNGIQVANPQALNEFMSEVPNLMGSTNAVLPRKELIAKQIQTIDETGRAKAGGQLADSNGYFYKGGQFLPNTNAEPGKWKIDKKWVKSGNELVEPGVRANGPTPFSRSIYGPMREFVEHPNNDFSKVKLKEGMKTTETVDGYQTYVPVTNETTWTPRLADYEHHTPVTIGELIDAYNKGQRWFDVKPDAVTITTK